MSEAVIIWQIAIGGIIVYCAHRWGKKGVDVAAVIAVIWTMAQVYTEWLSCFQFMTIFIAWQIGRQLFVEKKNSNNNSGSDDE